MNININILKPFEKWINTEKRLKIAFGGRGGGKSESDAEAEKVNLLQEY